MRLSTDERFAVPTTFVCCSISSAAMIQFAQAGHPMFADVTRLRDVELVDLPTGHWPMWSRPKDLSDVIAAAAGKGD